MCVQVGETLLAMIFEGYLHTFLSMQPMRKDLRFSTFKFKLSKPVNT